MQLSISHGWYMITSIGLFSQTWSILRLIMRSVLSLKTNDFSLCEKKFHENHLCENLFNKNYLRYHMASILILEV